MSGMVAGTPSQGGATWAVLQYLLGLRRLGHDVCLVEPVDVPDLTGSASARYCSDVLDRFGLGHRWCLVTPGRGGTAGMDRTAMLEFARSADLLINVSGMLTDEDVLAAVPVRVYLDLDPGFIQLWQAVEGIDMRFAAHNRFVTIGHGIAAGTSVVPDLGLPWLATHQPVVLEHWPRVTSAPTRGFTTVGHWRGYGSIRHDGVLFGQKVHSWRPLMDLPQRVAIPLEVALAIDPGETADLDALRDGGWRLVDPAAVVATPDDYASFVRSSTGEIGIAKSGYVTARCGWFSDRSLCYLASGRPVVVQDTGLAPYLPIGVGLLPFSDAEGAAAAIDDVLTAYPAHARAARSIAEDVFDSDRVLADLLARL